jgi:hypothetical protein
VRTWLTTATGCDCRRIDDCALFDDARLASAQEARPLAVVHVGGPPVLTARSLRWKARRELSRRRGPGEGSPRRVRHSGRRCDRPPRSMLRRSLHRAGDWLLGLAAAAAVVAMVAPLEALAARSDLIMAGGRHLQRR